MSRRHPAEDTVRQDQEYRTAESQSVDRIRASWGTSIRQQSRDLRSQNQLRARVRDAREL
jgi:hypothetical protein